MLEVYWRERRGGRWSAGAGCGWAGPCGLGRPAGKEAEQTAPGDAALGSPLVQARQASGALFPRPRRRTSPSPSEGSPSAPDLHLRHGARARRCPLHPARPGPEGPTAQLGGWEDCVSKGRARLCPREGGIVPKDPDCQGQCRSNEAAPQPLCPGPQGRTRKATKAPWGPGDTATRSGGNQAVGPWRVTGTDRGRWGRGQPARLGHSGPARSAKGSLATHSCMNTCGRDVCSGQVMRKGPHAHRRDKSQGVCRGRQQEGAGPAAMHPGCPLRGRQDGPCPVGPGSPPTRRRAGGGRGSRHWGPCRHSRDRQRGSGGGSERGRNRGGRQRWARVAAAVGTHASAQAQ